MVSGFLGDAARTRTGRWFLAGVVCACMGLADGKGQEASEEMAGIGAFHSFTDKQGRNLKARVVSVASDRKSMVIADESGATFPLEITKLSLDDQQYLKKWIATQPMLSNFRLRVDIEKISAKTSERVKSGNYRMVSEYPAYRIKVTNLSRDSLENAVVEYYIVKREKVRIYEDSETGNLTYGNTFKQDDPPETITEIKKLESLGYNREIVVETNPMTVDQVYYEGSQPYVEDVLLGMVVQVRDDFGNVLGEYRSADSGFKEKIWDRLKGEATWEPANTSAASSSNEIEPTPSPATKPSKRLLTEWPDVLEQGNYLKTRKVPDVSGKKVRITATVELDGPEATGTIVAMGGKNRGFGLCIADGDLQFLLRRFINEATSSKIRMPVTALPDRAFQVEAIYDDTNMSIAIDGEVRVSGPSIGLLDNQPFEGLSVGFDSETQSVGPNRPPDEFTGAIRDVRVEFED